MRFRRNPKKEDAAAEDAVAEEAVTEEPIIEEEIDEEQVEAQAPSWYDNWREKIHTWISQNTGEALADILLVIPDAFLLLARLATDRRVPFLVKGQLLLATAYVLSPLDLIPEALLGVVGLADDAGVIALALFWVKNIVGIDKSILNEHWSGTSDPLETIDHLHQQVTENADQLFDQEIWQRILSRFGKHGDPDIIEGEFVRPDDEKSDQQVIALEKTKTTEPKRSWLRFRRQQEKKTSSQGKQKIEITT